MRINSIITGILAITIYSCNTYDKLLKSPDNDLKLRKAMEYYQNEDYVHASTLFDMISNVFRGTTKADTVAWYQAQSYYKQQDYIMAGHYFRALAETYPYSPFARKSEFLEAYCYYLDSPRPSLDQTDTHRAIEAFSSFINKYPGSKEAGDARNYIQELRDKLVEKSRDAALLYYNMGYYKASIVALNDCLSDYPNTKYREDLTWHLLDSHYQLAANSIPEKQKERYQSTVDEYYSFISEFPNSSYKNEAQHIYEISLSHSK